HYPYVYFKYMHHNTADPYRNADGVLHERHSSQWPEYSLASNPFGASRKEPLVHVGVTQNQKENRESQANRLNEPNWAKRLEMIGPERGPHPVQPARLIEKNRQSRDNPDNHGDSHDDTDIRD